jgi:hypothetical protein
MSDNSFKVKNSLVLTPVDLATLLNPQAGDLACDINDNNKIKRYDAASASWVEVGSGGVGSLDILFAQDFESASLSSFTQTGLALDTVDPLHGKVSAKLTHQAGVSPTNDQSFKQIVAVDRKFRGKNATIELTVKSAASAGNVVLKITDETGSTDLVVSEQLQLSNNAGGASSSVSFDIPETCLSLSYTITALPEAGSPVTIIDDVYCALTASNLFQSGVVQEEDSTIQLQEANGYGSTATKIRRFVNTQLYRGSDILYQDSDVNGATFTVLSSGIYHIDYIDQAVGGTAAFLGITKNESAVTTNISVLASNTDNVSVLSVSRRYDASTDAAFLSANCSWSGYLEAGDVIRAHTNGVASVDADITRFVMSKQGSLKQVTVNSNQKITIPTSELRFEGASARGTGTETAIVQFTSLAKLRGDAFTVDNSNGTAITMTKAGKLDISASIWLNTAGSELGISLNQSTRTSAPTNSSEILAAQQIGTTAPKETLSFSGFVKAGDIIRIYATVIPVTAISNSLNLSFQEQEVSVSVTNTLPQFSESDSYIRVDTPNGYGSTATKIPRFNTVRSNNDLDIAYVDSASLGSSFTARSAGIYSINFSATMAVTAAAYQIGLTLNASGVDLSTSIASISSDKILATDGDRADGSGSNIKYASVSWTGYLSANDVVTPHTDGAALSVSTLTASKVGKPNVTGVDVTPFVNIPQPDTQSSYLYTNTSFSSSNPVTGSLTRSISSGIFSYNSSTGTYTVLKKGLFNLAYSNSAVGASITATVIILDGNAVAYNNTQSTATASNSCSYTEILLPGQQFYFRPSTNASNNHSISVTAEATSDQILTQTETFSTDTATLTYANAATYTLSTLANAPVGTYITFTYAANTNTRTQTTLLNRPTQNDADMNANGILLYTRAYNAPSTAAQPAAIAIQIGKGLKGISSEVYKSTGKSIGGSLQFSNNSAFSLQTGSVDGIIYDQVTGILSIDLGLAVASAITTSQLRFNDLTTQTSGYLVINASKNPALTGMAIPKTVFVEAANNAAQVVTAGTQDIPFIRVYDTNSAWNGTQFIVPEDGIYQVTACILTAAANNNSLALYKNGSIVSTMSIQGTLSLHAGTATIRCIAGDSLSVRVPTTSVTLAVGNTSHRLTVTKIAKYI